MWAHIGSAPRPLARLIRELVGLAGAALHQPTGHERIFLARKPSRSKKKLRNHREIEALAAGHGFRIVYPEDLGLLEQMRLAFHARAIIAPEGSNALLAWFARAGCKVCILSPPYTLPLVDVNAILAELDVDLSVFTGPDFPTEEDFCPYWNDYEIDAAEFSRFLSHWPEAEPGGLSPATAGSVQAGNS